MKITKYLPLFIFCYFFSLTLFASQIQDIYTTSVPIANRSPQALDQALPKALGEVLIKVSGNPGIITLPNLQPALAQASKLVQSYSFQQATSHTTEDNQPLVLQVSFDKAGVHSLLQNNHQAIWSVNRPLTLIWISNPAQPTQLGLSANDSNKITTTIKNEANIRGLPIIFPIMDLTDQNLMNSINKEGKFEQDSLQQAEQRYHADAVLAGMINVNANNQWQVQWRLLFNNQPLEWVTNGPDIATAVSSGINQAANLIASQQAVLDNKDLRSDLTIKVTNVNNLVEYANLLKYLRTINLINSVTVSKMDNSTVLVNLNIAGNEQDLNNVIAQNQKLVQLTQPNYGTEEKIDLLYQWQTPDNPQPNPYAISTTNNMPTGTAINSTTQTTTNTVSTTDTDK